MISAIRLVVRILLAGFMIYAGTGHFTMTDEFLAQVPPFFPAQELIVYVSGVFEIALGVGLLLTKGELLRKVGWALAAFYVVIFPGNISQFVTQTDAFGLNTDLARGIRLLFQPVLVAAALWASGAWPRRRS